MFIEHDRLLELVFQAAGAATAPLMQDHPDYVFPSERVTENVERVLREFSIDPKPFKPGFSFTDGPSVAQRVSEVQEEMRQAETQRTGRKENQ